MRQHDQQKTGEIQLERGGTSSAIPETKHPQQNGNVKKVDPTWKHILGWDLMFVLLGVIGVLGGDTLFFFLPLINENNRCIELDNRLKIAAYCLRSVFDVIYVANMIFNIRKKRFKHSDFAIDICALLPIPQILVPIILKKMRSLKFLDARMKILKFFVLSQYVPRIVRVVRNYLSWTETFAAGIWIKASFNFFVYTQACHVLGAFWYFFSIERQTTCWYKACKVDPKCIPSSFKCGHKLQNNTFLDDFCRVQASNTTLFDFGIFREALESGIVSSTDIPQKFVYCSWWGLRNLSSFGSNLETSNYIWENFFSIIISVFGLLLFLYFLGSVQTYIQMATQDAEEATKNVQMEAKKSDEKDN